MGCSTGGRTWCLAGAAGNRISRSRGITSELTGLHYQGMVELVSEAGFRAALGWIAAAAADLFPNHLHISSSGLPEDP